MNKKLEEWRDTKAAQSAHLGSQEHIGGFKTGFESCLALDLPVKFAEWKDKELTLDKFPDCYNYIEKKLEYYAPQYGYTEKYPLKFDHSKYELKSNEELFQYYLEHIHKFDYETDGE